MALASPQPAPAPAAAPWPAWGRAALDTARREGRPLCALVTAYGCSPCRELEHVLARQPAPHCAGLRVDADELPHVAEALATLAREADPRPTLPLLLALGPDGRLLDVAPAGPPDARVLSRWLAGIGATPATPRPTLAPVVGDPPEIAPAADPLEPPRLPSLRALTERLTRGSPKADIEAADRLLEAAARSAYRDHAGGGFHRARVPLQPSLFRYEKRLADNALWLRAFARGYGASGNLVLRDVCLQLVAWSIRDLRDASGAFWATIDAASGGQDGAFYRLTPDDVRAALGAERNAELRRQYDLEPPGLLRLRGFPFAGLSPSLDVLRVRRARRVRPAPDERIVAGANGLFIGALSVSGQTLKRGSDLEAARRAARAVLERLGPPATLRHSLGAHAAGGPATLGDYAYLAEGLLDLEAATGERDWRNAAVALVDAALTRLWDPQGRAFRGGEPAGPLAPSLWLGAHDGELPSPQGVMAGVLVRLGDLTEEPRYGRLARQLFESFARTLAEEPEHLRTLAGAKAADTGH